MHANSILVRSPDLAVEPVTHTRRRDLGLVYTARAVSYHKVVAHSGVDGIPMMDSQLLLGPLIRLGYRPWNGLDQLQVLTYQERTAISYTASFCG